MSRTSETRIEALQKKKAQIEAKVSQLKARSKDQNRKIDARRKILIGAIILQEMERRPETDAWVRKMLAERLTRPRDRALFDLVPLEEKAADGNEKA